MKTILKSVALLGLVWSMQSALLAEGLRNKCRMLGAEAVFDTTTQFQDFLEMMSSEKDAR